MTRTRSSKEASGSSSPVRLSAMAYAVASLPLSAVRTAAMSFHPSAFAASSVPLPALTTPSPSTAPIYAAAKEPKELWLLEGFGHAENAATPEILDRLGAHLPELVARGRQAA